MSPLIPLGILLAGAGALLFSLSARFPYPAATAIVTATLGLAALSVVGFNLPATAQLSAWGLAPLLPAGLVLAVDELAWLLAMGMAGVSLAALLTGLARPGGPRLAARGAILLLTFVGITALFAENLVTLVMAWAGLDFVYFLILILLARGEGVQPQAALHLTFNSLGTVLAMAASILISRERLDLALRAAIVSPESTLLITLAAVFRLGLFPLHLGLPVDTNVRQGLGTLLRLIPATVALEMVARLSTFGFAEPLRAWLTTFGVAAALVGAAQLWNSDEPRQGLTFVVIAQSGLTLLTGLWGGPQAVTGVATQTLALLLGGGLIFLANGFDDQHPWLAVLPGLGAATVIGLPLTVGFTALNGLYAGWLTSGNWALWLALAGAVVAQVFLAGGLLRAVSWPGDPVEGGSLGLVGYLAGLTLMAACAVLAGVSIGVVGGALGAPVSGPLGLTGTPNWAALALTGGIAAAGAGLWRLEQAARSRTEAAATLIMSVLRLDWLYRLIWGAIRIVDGVMFNLAGVLEGEGALLWALAMVLAVLLLFRS
jgi:formate hydrogenlyase subunit 3/multisubunit Na+/H+ antiporter MnhD subunit